MAALDQSTLLAAHKYCEALFGEAAVRALDPWPPLGEPGLGQAGVGAKPVHQPGIPLTGPRAAAVSPCFPSVPRPACEQISDDDDDEVWEAMDQAVERHTAVTNQRTTDTVPMDTCCPAGSEDDDAVWEAAEQAVAQALAAKQTRCLLPTSVMELFKEEQRAHFPAGNPASGRAPVPLPTPNITCFKTCPAQLRGEAVTSGQTAFHSFLSAQGFLDAEKEVVVQSNDSQSRGFNHVQWDDAALVTDGLAEEEAEGSAIPQYRGASVSLSSWSAEVAGQSPQRSDDRVHVRNPSMSPGEQLVVITVSHSESARESPDILAAPPAEASQPSQPGPELVAGLGSGPRELQLGADLDAPLVDDGLEAISQQEAEAALFVPILDVDAGTQGCWGEGSDDGLDWSAGASVKSQEEEDGLQLDEHSQITPGQQHSMDLDPGDSLAGSVQASVDPVAAPRRRLPAPNEALRSRLIEVRQTSAVLECTALYCRRSQSTPVPFITLPRKCSSHTGGPGSNSIPLCIPSPCRSQETKLGWQLTAHPQTPSHLRLQLHCCSFSPVPWWGTEPMGMAAAQTHSLTASSLAFWPSHIRTILLWSHLRSPRDQPLHVLGRAPLPGSGSSRPLLSQFQTWRWSWSLSKGRSVVNGASSYCWCWCCTVVGWPGRRGGGGSEEAQESAMHLFCPGSGKCAFVSKARGSAASQFNNVLKSARDIDWAHANREHLNASTRRRLFPCLRDGSYR